MEAKVSDLFAFISPDLENSWNQPILERKNDGRSTLNRLNVLHLS